MKTFPMRTTTNHIIHKTMKRIIEYFKGIRDREQMREEMTIKGKFKVTEGGGWLWLTHDGVAFMKVASLAKAEDVAKALNEARECAVEFERL